MSNGAKMLILGLDGADWRVLKPLMEAGKVPNLQRLYEDGTTAPLNSTMPPMTLPSWSSMLTGCNPGKHGIFDFVVKDPKKWALEFSNATHRMVPTLHEILSGRGGRVASIAVPTTWPPSEVNGVMVSGFDSPVSTGIDGSFCHPTELYAELLSRFGGLRFADFQESDIYDGWHHETLHLMKKEIKRKSAIASWLLQQERWDCFMLLFGESDTVSHHFWMFYDENSPRHPQRVDPILRSAIPDIYVALDSAVGQLLEKAQPDVVCICSDHGFGGAGEHVLYLNRYLERHGLLRYKRDVHVSGMRSGDGLWDRMRSSAVRRIPARYQGKVFRSVPTFVKNHMESRSRYGNIDFSQTSALSDEMNYAATLRLCKENTAPEVEERLREVLLDWQVDGCPVVSKLHRREDLYWGTHVSRSPEIILELNEREGYSYTLLPSQRSPKGQVWRRLDSTEWKGGKGLGMNGSHRQHGILILAGSNIQSQQVQAGMNDIAPTLLHAAGEAIPRHMDGEVLKDAFAEKYDPQYCTEQHNVVSPQPISRQEKEAIRKRLEGLGYL